MKIAYVENIRLPTEKAHGVQIMKMCEAFASLGHEVSLFVSKRGKDETSPFKYYGVKNNFKIKKVYVPNILSFGRIGFFIQTLFFSEMASFKIASFRPDIIITRDERIIFNYILRFRNLVWEAHRGSWNFIVKTALRYAKSIVVISKGLENLYKDKFPRISNKIFLSPDGVDISLFDINFSKDECRKRLDLPLKSKIALYSGHLYGWKGVNTLARSAEYLAQNEIIIFVGGTKYDLDKFKKENLEHIKNGKVIIFGQRLYEEIPLFLKSADVLVLPNSSKELISRLYTSPLKLFEYMSSKRPILASNIPSLKEILNEENAVFFDPDSSKSLYENMHKLFYNQDMCNRISERAFEKVKSMTWNNRAKAILDFINKTK